MDSVYKADGRNFVSPSLKPAEVLKEFSQILELDSEIFCSRPIEASGFEDAAKADLRNLAEYFGIDEDTVNNSFRKTLPSSLGIGIEEPPPLKRIENPLSDLQISDMLSEGEQMINPCSKIKGDFDPHLLKLRPKALIISEPTDSTSLYKKLEPHPPNEIDGEHEAESRPDIVYTVRVYAPVEGAVRRVMPHMDNFVEFQFFGKQKLTDLRDVIPCINNKVLLSELSNDRKNVGDYECGLICDLYPSGMLHIGRTLYDDMRRSGSTRYSQTLIQWDKTKIRPANFQSALMEETCFDDLELRLGFPYVYHHFADCEHLILFVDVRLLHPTDIGNPESYPILTRTPGPKQDRCYACDIPKARWLIVGSERIPVPTAFFCELCTERYFYKGHEKVGDFKMYRVEPDLRFASLKDVGTDLDSDVLMDI